MTSAALIFAPVLATWDDGAAIEPIRQQLQARGLQCEVIDTCALAAEASSIDDLADRWRRRLGPRAGRPALICGNALGGAVAVAMATQLDRPTPILSVSGPVRATATLRDRLSAVAALADTGDTAAALRLLASYVGDPNTPVPDRAEFRTKYPDRAASRIAAGLSLLCTVDLTAAAAQYRCPIVTIVGRRSQLVTFEHCAQGPTAETIVVDDAAMRPHHTHPECLTPALDDLLMEYVCD